MTKIILVRHGHVEGIEPERFRGRLDLKLTETGRRQAQAAAKRIAATWSPAAIYTSPMSRCIATGTAVGAPLNLEVKPDPRLNDIDYGEWQGLTPSEARSKSPDALKMWFRSPHLAKIPGGETLQALMARAADAVQEILRNYPHEVVVLVGHDSINRVILLHALDLPLSRYWRLKQDPCGISELDFDNELFTVWSMNETWHLKGR